MQEEIYIAGVGGQGALSMGQMLAYAGLAEGKNVSYVPFYGVEKRGGVANCGVIISGRPVNCPIVFEPTVLVAMNNSSLKRHEFSVVPGGLVIINWSLVDSEVERQDVRVVGVRASELAEEMGDVRVANNIILGVLSEITGVVSGWALKRALEEVIPERHRDLMEINVRALEKGAGLWQSVRTAAGAPPDNFLFCRGFSFDNSSTGEARHG